MTFDEQYVIWSIEHHAWWRADHVGYTPTLFDAGFYSRAEADAIVARANIVAFHECAIPVRALRLLPEETLEDGP